MDVVGRNVAGFDLPSSAESAHYALASEAQAFYCDPAKRAVFSSRQDSDLPMPPCVCDAQSFNFSPTSLESGHRSTDISGAPQIDSTVIAEERANRLTETFGKESESTEITQLAQSSSSSQSEFKGSLFLIGGHADNTFYELLKLAPRNPKVVVVGRASGLPGADESLAEDFFKAGVKLDDITVVIPKDYEATDTRFKHSYEVPSDADIVYFGGGAQDKLRREFDDHQLEQVHELLQKGAMIAGNSAGTAVMSKDMINGGNEHALEQAHGFGLTPWAILDTHVGQRHREARDVKALYEIGEGQRPVIGLDEDTRVRFYWSEGKLLGEIGGKGSAKVFQTPEMTPLSSNRQVMPKIISDGANREALMWELKEGDTFEVILPNAKAPTSIPSVSEATQERMT